MTYCLLWWVENGNEKKKNSMLRCRNNAQVLDGWNVFSCAAWTKSSQAAAVSEVRQDPPFH